MHKLNHRSLSSALIVQRIVKPKEKKKEKEYNGKRNTDTNAVFTYF